MRFELHPVVWAAVGLALGAVVLTSPEWVVTALVLATVIALSLFRGGPRVPAMNFALLLGGIGFGLRLLVGIVFSPVGPDATLIAFLPEVDLGHGAQLLGPLTVEKLGWAASDALRVFALFSLLGLMWQACSWREWTDLGLFSFGRGGRLLTFVPALGDGVSQLRGQRVPLRSWSTPALFAPGRDAYGRKPSGRYRPSPGHASVAAVLALGLLAGVLLLGFLGGMKVQLSPDQILVLPARTLLVAVLVVWLIARAVVSGARPQAALRWQDWLALLPAAVLLIAADPGHLIDAEGTSGSLLPGAVTGEWGQLILLAAAAGMWVLLGHSARKALVRC